MLYAINNKQEGYTLIELMLVVAIISILVATAIPQFMNYRVTAAKGVIQSDAKNCATKCSAEFETTHAAVPNCGCTAGANSVCSGSVDNTGVVTASCAGTGAYTGSCSYDSNTGQTNCS